MENILKNIPLLSKLKNKSAEKERLEYNKLLLKDIQQIRKQLDDIEAKYNLLSDNDLLESLIFEERSLKAKYAYLLRLAKTKGVTNHKINELI